jgi:hypothetical protein
MFFYSTGFAEGSRWSMVVHRWQTWELAELELGVVLVDLFVSRKGASYYLATPIPCPSPSIFWNHGFGRKIPLSPLVYGRLRVNSFRTNNLATISASFVIKGLPEWELRSLS